MLANELQELKTTRNHAGSYEWTFRGESGSFLYERTAYGDVGWFYYHDTGHSCPQSQRSDFPLDTLREVKAMLVRTLIHNAL